MYHTSYTHSAVYSIDLLPVWEGSFITNGFLFNTINDLNGNEFVRQYITRYHYCIRWK